MLTDVVGYCQIKPDATGQTAIDISAFRGKPCRAFEINHQSKSALVIDPAGTGLGMFDFDQIHSMFECQSYNGLLIPPGLDIIDAMLYCEKVFSQPQNLQRDMDFIRKMVVVQSLMKGKFIDTLYFNFSTQSS